MREITHSVWMNSSGSPLFLAPSLSLHYIWYITITSLVRPISPAPSSRAVMDLYCSRASPECLVTFFFYPRTLQWCIPNCLCLTKLLEFFSLKSERRHQFIGGGGGRPLEVFQLLELWPGKPAIQQIISWASALTLSFWVFFKNRHNSVVLRFVHSQHE